MKIKHLFLILCIIGTILPYTQFISFFAENGLNLPLFFKNAFMNYISAGFALDLTVSAIVLIIFILSESKKLKIKNFWLPIISIFLVGISLAFPLFLYQRELVLDKYTTK